MKTGFLKAQQRHSRSDLERFLESIPSRVRVGWNREAAREFYSVDVEHSGQRTAVGLCAAGHGPQPVFVLFPHQDMLVIGSDTEVVGVDLSRKRQSFSHQLAGVFFSFHCSQGEDWLLAVHELGAVKLRLSGDLDWSVDTDIVAESHLTGGILAIKTMGSPSLVPIDVVSGRIVGGVLGTF